MERCSWLIYIAENSVRRKGKLRLIIEKCKVPKILFPQRLWNQMILLVSYYRKQIINLQSHFI